MQAIARFRYLVTYSILVVLIIIKRTMIGWAFLLYDGATASLPKPFLDVFAVRCRLIPVMCFLTELYTLHQPWSSSLVTGRDCRWLSCASAALTRLRTLQKQTVLMQILDHTDTALRATYLFTAGSCIGA